MVPPPADASVAYHEAGHAVIALALGRPVHRVSIRPKERWLGRCEFGKGRLRPDDDPVETEILIMLGGAAAEGRCTGEYAWDAAAGDLWEVRELTIGRAKGDRRVERLERRMLKKVEHIFADAGVWRAVVRIAEELVARTEISGRAARHLFEQETSRDRD